MRRSSRLGIKVGGIPKLRWQTRTGCLPASSPGGVGHQTGADDASQVLKESVALRVVFQEGQNLLTAPSTVSRPARGNSQVASGTQLSAACAALAFKISCKNTIVGRCASSPRAAWA